MKLREVKELLDKGAKEGTLDMELPLYGFDPKTGSNLEIEFMSLFNTDEKHSKHNPLVVEMVEE